MTFSEEKATAVATFFLSKAGGELEDLKLMKLMYLAEREAIRVRNVGITGDAFFSMKNGPILSKTLDRMTPRDQVDVARVWREHIRLPDGWNLRISEPFEPSRVLSKREITIIETIWKDFGDWTKWQLVDHTHDFFEWSDPGETSKPIAFQDILKGLGFEGDELDSRYAEHQRSRVA